MEGPRMPCGSSVSLSKVRAPFRWCPLSTNFPGASWFFGDPRAPCVLCVRAPGALRAGGVWGPKGAPAAGGCGGFGGRTGPRPPGSRPGLSSPGRGHGRRASVLRFSRSPPRQQPGHEKRLVFLWLTFRLSLVDLFSSFNLILPFFSFLFSGLTFLLICPVILL